MNYALITGASSGIGLNFAQCLYNSGYSIVIVSNRPDENIKAKELIGSSGGNGRQEIRTIDADLSLSDAAENIFKTTENWKIRIDILVCNAGMLLFSTLDNTPTEKLEKIINLHCMTTTKLVRLYGKGMSERKEGYLLITSSSTAWMPYPTISHYAATKAYLKSFSMAIWYEYRRNNVKVTTVYPGAVDTPLYRLSIRKRKVLRMLGIMQTPEAVASGELKRMFAGKQTYIPGFFTKTSIALCRILPRCIFVLLLKLPILKKILDNA